MIEIKKHGSFLETDYNGFVIPKVNLNLIQKKWKPLIEDVNTFYKKVCGDDLLSIYIRGSVAKGEAVEGISDFDSFCITKEKVSPPKDEGESFNKSMAEKYPFCTHVELSYATKDDIFEDPPERRSIVAELIKTQSVCIFGEDFADKIKPFSPKDLIGHSYYIEKELTELPQYIEEDKDLPNGLEDLCSWICRRIVRSGFDLVMEREDRFTRDLYLCYESFSKYYPDKEELMREFLNLSLNPSSDFDYIQSQIDKIGPWLLKELKSQIFT